jgi:AcrR family transcriptional regulator
MSANALFGPESPIMRPQSFHRGENCTDVAIPLIAAGGCRAVSAGALAGRLGVTPAAVLKWFGSTARMWEEIAAAIGRRWYAHLDEASRSCTDTTTVRRVDPDVFEAVALLLPLDENEIAWTRVWLSVLEQGRHQDLVGAQTARWEAQEVEVLHRGTTCRDLPTLTATMVVVRGLRQMVAATHEPLDLDTAHEVLRRHVEQSYVDGGVPEPATDADVLSSTRRFEYFPPRPAGR